jgi:hypothetical protein
MESDSDKENDEHDFPVVDDEVPVSFVESRKGRPLLVDPFNYVYNRMKEVGDKVYWRCQREVSKLFPR